VSEATRFSVRAVTFDDGTASVIHSSDVDGEYVLHADYARLKAEVERLTELNATIALRYDATKSMLDGCAKEIEEMEAEVERLRKAGDELAGWFLDYHPSAIAWNAAKEGKQS